MFTCTYSEDKNRSSTGLRFHGVAVVVALTLARLTGGQTATRAAEEYTVKFAASFQDHDSSVELEIASAAEKHRLLLSPKRLIWKRSGSITRRFRWGLPLNRPHPMILQCRKSQLAIIFGNRMVASRGRKEGACRFGFEKVHGAELSKFRFQPVDPVRFSDDFMRTEVAGQSFWRRVTGNWSLASAPDVEFAASPFRILVPWPGGEMALRRRQQQPERVYHLRFQQSGQAGPHQLRRPLPRTRHGV